MVLGNAGIRFFTWGDLFWVEEMKVLIVLPKIFPLGGVEKLTIDFIKELYEREFIIDLLFLHKIDALHNEKFKDLRYCVNNIYCLDLQINPSYWQFFPSIYKISELLKKEKYDFIESSSVSGTILACWASFLLRCNLKLIIGLHFCRDHPSFGKKRDFLLKYSLKICRSTYIYGVSDTVIKSFSEYSLKNSIVKIPNSLGKEFFNMENNHFKELELKKKLCIKPQSKIVLYVGRIDIFKGVKELFDSVFPILCDDIYLVLIGVIDENAIIITENFKNQLKNAGKDKYVTFLGQTLDVRKYMCLSDVLVLPSYSEASPVVLIEALASGLPIVASRIDGILELLDGTDSIFVDVGDSIQLRHAILMALNIEPEIKLEIIKKGILRVNTYTIEKRVENIISLINQ
jgi:glycosyltransferase involved in cell wall biosynthesis